MMRQVKLLGFPALVSKLRPAWFAELFSTMRVTPRSVPSSLRTTFCTVNGIVSPANVRIVPLTVRIFRGPLILSFVNLARYSAPLGDTPRSRRLGRKKTSKRPPPASAGSARKVRLRPSASVTVPVTSASVSCPWMKALPLAE